MLRDKREDTASENQGQIALKNNKLRNKKYLRKKKRERERGKTKVPRKLEYKFR